MAIVLTFDDLYTSGCEHCGADLEWEWLEDEMYFATSCTCGIEYVLKPTSGILTSEAGDLLDEEENEDD